MFLLFIFILVRRACAPLPYEGKTPISLDISGVKPKLVAITKSEAYDDGKYFFVKREQSPYNMLGDISDGDEKIILTHPSNVNRFVFSVSLLGGAKYVRVVSKNFEPDGSLTRHINEFLKRPGDIKYREIIRIPLDVDIPLQPETAVIQIDHSVDYTARRFIVRPEMRFRFTLGLVRFGQYVLNQRTQGLIDRDIIWEGGMNEPRITVISRYKNGNCVTSMYKYLGENRGFIVTGRKTIQVFKYPKDEEVRVTY